MIARGAIQDATGVYDKGFTSNSNQEFTILQKLFSTLSVWTHVMKYEQRKEGQAARRTLTKYFFGTSKYKTLQDSIRNRLDALVYNRPRKHFSFKKFVNMHVALLQEAHDLLEYSPSDMPMFNEETTIWRS